MRNNSNVQSRFFSFRASSFNSLRARFKADLTMRMENVNTLTEDLAVQLLCCQRNTSSIGSADESGIRSAGDICGDIDRLQLSEFNKVSKTISPDHSSSMFRLSRGLSIHGKCPFRPLERTLLMCLLWKFLKLPKTLYLRGIE